MPRMRQNSAIFSRSIWMGNSATLMAQIITQNPSSCNPHSPMGYPNAHGRLPGQLLDFPGPALRVFASLLLILLPPSQTPHPQPAAHTPCNLEPFKPETPKIALYVALVQGRLTLQVVCLGLAHFQLPVLPPKPPSPPTGENPGRPWGGWAGDPPCWCGCIHRAETWQSNDPFPRASGALALSQGRVSAHAFTVPSTDSQYMTLSLTDTFFELRRRAVFAARDLAAAQVHRQSHSRGVQDLHRAREVLRGAIKVLVQVDGPVLGTPSAGGVDGSKLRAGAPGNERPPPPSDREKNLYKKGLLC